MRKTTLTLLATLIAMLGLFGVAYATHIFPDVEDDNTHAENIYWAEDNGVVVGYEDGNFGPDDFIKRDQATSMFKRYHDAFAPRDGEDGADGATGPAGPTGPQGEPGADGEDGLFVDAFIVESSDLNFSAGGWAGWSCPEGTTLINGAISGVAAEQSVSVIGPATYPHYSYAAGEHGLAVRSSEAGVGTITLICAGEQPS